MVDKRVEVAVDTEAGSKFKYGFRSPNLTLATTLGLEPLVSGTAPAKDVVFSPKNGRPYKAYRPGTVAKGGLCDFSKTASLETAGYQVSRKRAQNPTNGPKSVIIGTRLSANVVIAWRYPKTKWDLLPVTVRTAADVKLVSDWPANEVAYHADGFILKTADSDLGLLAGKYYSVHDLRQTFTQGVKRYRIYSGKVGSTVAGT